MINLENLENNLKDLQGRYLQWKASIDKNAREAFLLIGINGYTEQDYELEIESIYRKQNAIYNPRLAMRPLLNEVLSDYVEVSPTLRATIRDIFGKFYHASGSLLEYILECAECLETADDEDVFRLGLIAASIENYAFDFRDTDTVLAEFAIAAVKAGVEMKPHCATIAELCSDSWGKGGGFMKRKIA